MRVSRLPKDEAPTAARLAYEYSERRYGHVLGPVEVTARHPRLLAGYSAFELALDRSRTVDARLKDLGALKAAAIVGCEWCIDFGSKLMRDLGVTDEQLRALADYRESEAFSDEEKLVLEYAEALSATPVDVPDELFERLRERFDEEQLVELTTAIALENYRARFNHAFGLASEGFSAGEFCPMPEGAR